MMRNERRKHWITLSEILLKQLLKTCNKMLNMAVCHTVRLAKGEHLENHSEIVLPRQVSSLQRTAPLRFYCTLRFLDKCISNCPHLRKNSNSWNWYSKRWVTGCYKYNYLCAIIFLSSNNTLCEGKQCLLNTLEYTKHAKSREWFQSTNFIID
jgi:hypothetical protein